jgi:hypothetical protein
MAEAHVAGIGQDGSRHDFYITYNGARYGIKYESFQLAFKPTNFDYMHAFTEAAEALEKSKKPSGRFEIFAEVEKITPEKDRVQVSYLMPGHINQVMNIYLDPRGQDFSGNLGLQINCLIEPL